MKTTDYIIVAVVAVLALLGLFAPTQNTPVVSQSAIVGEVVDILSKDLELAGDFSETTKYFGGGIVVQDDLGVDNFVVTEAGLTTYREKYEAITTTDVVTASQSNTTFYVSGVGSTTTLPAVASSAGVVVRYVVSGALTTPNFIIDSAEGDNIEGSLIVAGAVVDCDAEDQLNIVIDGENLGDFVELRSDGSKWFITQSNVLTSAKMTCTDPN
jgi:hypothetical protein